MKERRTASVAAVAVAAFFAILYHLTATFAYSYDGLCYSLDAEFGPLTNLFHPNHLFYSFLAHLLYRTLIFMGHSYRAIFLMQAMNAIVGGAAIGVFFAILARRFGWKRALLGAVALGVSNAFWGEAVDPGCYAWAMLATCGLLALLTEADSLPPFWLGVAHGIAILFHQMLLLTIPAFIWRIWKGKPLSYLLGVAFVVIGAYGSLGAYFHGGSLSEALYWALGPAGPPPNTPILSSYWWSLDLVHNTTASWQSLVHSMVANVSGPLKGIIFFWQGIALGLIVFAVAASVRYFKNKSIIEDEVGALWVWVLVMAIFQFFFWVGVLRYRLLFLPPLIYLLLELSHSYKDSWPFMVIGMAVGLAALVNYQTVIRPQAHPENNPSLMRSGWVSQTLQPGDGFLFSGGGSASIINIYMAYFAPQIRGRSVQGYFFANPHGDLAELQMLAEETRHLGKHLFIEAALWDPADQKALEEIGQVQPGTLQKWLARFQHRGERTGPGGYQIYKVS